MNKLQFLQDIYYHSISAMASDMEKWKEFLRYASSMYRYDFSTLITAFEQNRSFTQLASYKDWQESGRQVRRGEKSIPVLIQNQNNMDHFFDASQVNGKQPVIWKIEEGDRAEFEKRFALKYSLNEITGIDAFQDMTMQVILRGWRDITGRFPVGSELRNAFLTDFLFQSIQYMVQYRCSYIMDNNTSIKLRKYPEVNQNTIGELGYYAVKTARDILLDSKEILLEIRREQEYERRQKDREITEWDGDGIRGEGRHLVRSSEGGEEQGILQTSGQVRKDGREILAGEQAGRASTTSDRRDPDGDITQDRGKSRTENGGAAGANAVAGSGQKSEGHHGSISAPAEDTRPGGGNHSEGDHIQLELKLEDLQNNKEPRKGAEQSTPFFIVRSYGQKLIPDEIIEEAILEGPGMANGKQRLAQGVISSVPLKEKLALIKKEYQNYGQGRSRDYGLQGFDCFNSIGMKIEWIDNQGEHTEMITWKQIHNVIQQLIEMGSYRHELESDNLPDTVSVKGGVNKHDRVDDDIPEDITRINYRSQSDRILVEGGIKSRFKDNIAAIQLLNKIEAEERLATNEEQEVLSRYIGWGGMAGAFDERNNTWAQEYHELKQLLDEAEYTNARASTTTAFYTSPDIVKGIYTVLQGIGFQGGKVLEPSLAIGNFFTVIPEQIENNSKLYGVEMDSISGRIARQLHQTADISICGYEQTAFHDNEFDLAIGNVPFGDYKIFDKRYNKLNFNIHDYFFAKSLDLVKPGGIVAFITSKGTLDKANPTVRRYLAQRADLLGAMRLPNIAFKDAVTEVTSDIIFLQKRERIQVSEARWIYTGLTEDKVPVNLYYLDNPQMLLGHMQFDTRMYGTESKYTTLTNKHPETFPEQYKEAIQLLIDQVKLNNIPTPDMEKKPTLEEQHTIPADPDVKNFCYCIMGEEIFYQENSIMMRIDLSRTKSEQMKALIELRMAAREMINLQMEECTDQELEKMQSRLHHYYDTYVSKYGYLSEKTSSLFRQDADYPLILSLEYTDKDNKVKKADIFYKRTIRPYHVIEHVDNAREGLMASITEKGKVDISYIAKLSDRSMDKVLEELSEDIFLNPEKYQSDNPYVGYESADEYLCGNVRAKLRIASLFAERDPIFIKNVEALTNVQPEELSASDIEVRLGTTWIEEEDYNRFIYELLDTPYTHQYRGETAFRGDRNTGVRYNSFTSSFSITNKVYAVTSRIRASETYGTSRLNAYQIIEDSLNLKTVVVKDRLENEKGNFYYVVNKKETILAREKQGLIKTKFKEWFWSDLGRRDKYVRKYNELFNNIRLREYDGSRLVFPGMNPEIALRMHQKNAVARIIFGQNTLLAHCVGAGKTYEMIAGIMEQKRLGFLNKSMLCVPNHLTEQIGNDFIKLYPAANILVATKADFEPLNRRTFISKIATGEYDAVIIGHTQFEKIPISPEREQAMIKEQISLAENAIERIREENGEHWSIKQMEKFKKNLEVELLKLRDSRRDNVIHFEELGIDSLLVDEAHYYKNCAVFSKMRNVAGISTSKAKKSTDMLMKCQYIQEMNNGRGVVFATGTPISNSMTELFVMQRYLQNKELRMLGFEHFDAWAANFGEIVSSLELAPEGTGYRFKNRFAKFTNIPELMIMFREIADIQLPEMLNLPVPKLRNGKYNIAVSEPGEYIRKEMKKFADRAEEIRNGNVDPSIDNMLKITNEAKLLGTDPRLLDPAAPNEPGSKVNLLVENIHSEYVASNNVKGTQIVFCDVGTPNMNGRWSVYHYIKEELIRFGISENEICFIHDANTEKQRERLFEDLRAGRKRIIIGSTPKMGTGTNIQDRLVAVHHLDCPWRPADLEQRDGRALRQGNMNEYVAIYRYVTKETFDAYSWQLVEQKQKFIAQVMTTKSISRTCEDIDDTVLSYAEVKALATGNPLIKEKMDIDTEVARLRMLKAGFLSEKYKYEEGYQRVYPKEIEHCKKSIKEVTEDIKLRSEHQYGDESFMITLMGKIYTERREAGEVLMTIMQMNEPPKSIGIIKGFEITTASEEHLKYTLSLRGEARTYRAEMGGSDIGNINRLENVINGLDDMLLQLEETLKNAQDNLMESRRNAQNQFIYDDELTAKEKRQSELNQILELDKHVEVLADDETVMEEKHKDIVFQRNEPSYESEVEDEFVQEY